MAQNRRKKKFIGTPLQNKMLLLIFLSAVIPAGIATATLYYLIFHLLAYQIGIPEEIAYNLIPVLRQINLIIFVTLPFVLLLIWFIALELSHRIAGPLFRLDKELDERIAGITSGPIRLRKKDELKLLAEKINRLVAKFSAK
jgi:membrane protein implicated in regulation of membrane protease activity